MAEDYLQSTMKVSGINMNTHLTMTRIQNARRAMVRAQNPWFRNYWGEVADTLQAQLVESHG